MSHDKSTPIPTSEQEDMDGIVMEDLSALRTKKGGFVSTVPSIVSQNEPGGHFFGVQLSEERPVYTWPEDDTEFDAEDRDACRRVLTIRQASLGITPMIQDRNMVQIGTKIKNGDIEYFNIAILALSQIEMAPLDFEFSEDRKLRLKLVSGSGPVYITGHVRHSVVYNLNSPTWASMIDNTKESSSDDDEDEGDSEDIQESETEEEDEEGEEHEMEEESEEEKVDVKATKTKGNPTNGAGKKHARQQVLHKKHHKLSRRS